MWIGEVGFWQKMITYVESGMDATRDGTECLEQECHKLSSDPPLLALNPT